MEPVIELQQVSRSFGESHVLRDISLAVQAAETLVLIGESGCGKSVTMKLMMSLLQPDRGQVLWDGRPLNDRSRKELDKERLQFGYLFQGAALFDSMNVYDNVAFGLKNNTDLIESEIKDIVVERLREVGLSDDICNRKPAELSGGMKKRVGLARALALSPDVIFYDEPTTGLDPIMSDVINELILQIRSHRPVTSIIVTHDMKTVKKVADRVVMFYPLHRLHENQPQLIFEGSMDEAYSSSDPRVFQFVNGQAGNRIQEMAMVS